MRSLIVGMVLACALAVLMTGAAVAAPDPPPNAQILNNQHVQKSETVVGNIVADAFRASAQTDIALVSAGDLKPLSSSITSDGIKAADVTVLLMYPGDKVVTMALDGGKIRKALETSVGSYALPSLSFLQVSGMKFTFDPARPKGQRVTSVIVNGANIVNEKSYTVAMLNSMAGGALGYWKVWSKRNVVAGAPSVTSASAVESYIRDHPRPALSVEGRINVAK